MKIGLSLSLCVKDIIKGKVNRYDVCCIITNTFADDASRWHQLMLQYGTTHWNDCTMQAIAIAQKFYDDGKIVQPRCNGQPGPRIHNGIWLEIEDVGYV